MPPTVLHHPADFTPADVIPRTGTARIQDSTERVERRPAPAVTAVVVSWNNLALTTACLRSFAQQEGAEIETIVVDNGSTDGTVDHLRTWVTESSHHKAILNEANLGFAPAVNQGLRAASGDVLIVLNDDVVLAPGSIATLVGHLMRDPRIGLCGPVTNRIDNEAEIEIRYDSITDMPAKAEAHVHRHLGETFDLPVLAFFCVAMRRSTYESVGDLDERFTVGFFEDDDYCRRVSAAGLRVVCCRDAFVHHESSASFARFPPAERALIFETNRRRFEEKWGPWKHPRRKQR